MNACIYARVSSLGDRQNTARQVDDLTAYAARNDLRLVRTFTEKASGAKSRSERPVLNECLIYCVREKIDILLVSELSRLGRNTDDVLRNVMYCKEAGLNVYFQKEQFSIFTADGKPHPFLMIFISVLGTIAEMERENIAFRLQSGREKYIRDGGKLGRKEGYQKPPEDYERDYPDIFRELRRRDRLSYERIAKITDHNKRTVITCARILEAASQKAPNPASQKTE